MPLAGPRGGAATPPGFAPRRPCPVGPAPGVAGEGAETDGHGRRGAGPASAAGRPVRDLPVQTWRPDAQSSTRLPGSERHPTTREETPDEPRRDDDHLPTHPDEGLPDGRDRGA